MFGNVEPRSQKLSPKPRVLVTGGSGFLGQSVVPALIERCDFVVSADIRPPQNKVDDVHYVHCDVTDANAVDEIVRTHQIDTIVHLAAIVNPDPSMDRELIHQIDVGGTQNVLDAAIKNGVDRIVVTSSGAAYGYFPDNPLPLKEEDPIRGNVEFAYSHHKRLVEELLAQTSSEHPDLKQVILRVGTILGESVDNQITALFKRPKLLKVSGHDSPFVFIWDEDLTEIVVKSVTTDTTGIFNVAGDGWLSVDELAEILGKKVMAIPAGLLKVGLWVAQKLRVSRYGPEQVRFLQYRPVLDNSKLKSTFGYSPKLTSREAFVQWAKAANLI